MLTQTFCGNLAYHILMNEGIIPARESVSERERLKPKPRIEFEPAWIAAFVGCSYILGFLIISIHFGRYRPLDFELLEARYLAAAFLFMFITGIAAGFYFVLIRGWGEVVSELIPNSSRRNRWILRLALTLVGAIIGLLCWESAVQDLVISGGVPRMPTGIFFYLLVLFDCGLIELLLYLHKLSLPAESPRFLNSTIPTLCIVAVGILIALLSEFATEIFPDLKPAMGGGGAWVAHIVPEPGALPADLAARVSPETIILEVDDDQLTLLLCPATASGDKLEPVVVARSKFAAVSVREVIAANEFKTYCADFRRARTAAPAPAAPPRPDSAQAR